ncbi:MAG TPA: S9 family peptidase [Longimicrobiaceae bacterium]
MRSFRGAAITGLIMVATVAAGTLQAQNPVTVERIFASDDFQLRSVSLEWMPNGNDFLTIEEAESGQGSDLWVEGIRTGTRSRLAEAPALAVGDSVPPTVAGVTWSPDGTRMLLFTNAQRVWRLATRGTYLVYEPATGRVIPVDPNSAGRQMFAKFSPDGTRVGFVRDNDLYVTDLNTGQVHRLTTDGSDVIINGTTDWVYEEELDLRDAWRWSPDGNRIAFWQFDQSPVETFYMIDQTSLYARPIPLRYPKAGTSNSRVRIGVIDLATGETTWVNAGDDPQAYLARMDFAASPTEVAIQRLNRTQNQVDVLLADVTTGKSRVILSETAPSWLDVNDDLLWIRDGQQFLWLSERDGFNHIYLYDRSGRLVRQVTRGNWEVVAIEGLDEDEEWVYFTAANPTPAELQLFRARLQDGRLQRISTEPGSHSIEMSPDGSIYLDAYSRNGVPPVYRLHEADGDLIRVLEDNSRVADNLVAAGATPPSFFSFITSDGVRLNGWMIRPPDFDPMKKYPVLLYAYGGPGSQTVTDAWQGSRYLWHQALAAEGYIVVSVDNRGTGGRGRDFKNLVYMDLGHWEANDQIEAARYLASLPYVDAERIGMWGWSYGGYLTALTLMKGGGLFRAGISVAPVTDWHLYDTIYTERYMRTPQENPEGYRKSAPLNHAGSLESDFLLIHGTGDDNVHFQNSVLLANRLQAENKQFDFMLYPNQTHAISDSSLHLFTLMTRWLRDHL